MQNSRHLPPQNIASEQSVLGGLLTDPEAWTEVSDLLQEDDFYKPAHQKIFAAIRDLYNKAQHCDLITVTNYLMDKKQLDLIGGPAYLAELIEKTPTAANIQSYAKIVHEKSLLRKMIRTSSKIIEKAYEQDFEDINSFIDEAESSIFSVAEQKSSQGLTSSSEIVKISLEKLDELCGKKGDITGIPTGFIELDKLTAGLHAGELIILAARPSMGKTALSLNIALHAALREKKSVAYFSLEMAKEQVMIRALASESQVELQNLRIGQIKDQDWPRIISTAAKLSESRLYIDDTSGISPFEIRSKARRLQSKEGLDLIVVDYLQLMTLKQKVENREREVSEISKMLKAIAKELQVPVLSLAQLNRGVEGRSDRRPLLSDLRESGSIEQDADIIMMIYREEYYDRDNPDVKGLAEVIIGKQRNGPTGVVKLKWLSQYGLFVNNIEDNIGPLPPLPDPGKPSFRANLTPIDATEPPPKGPPKNFAPKL
ncbi:MAG: replicative DNA helicase [Planctomycetota bacterium]|nr:MAG: replicative DNA helicase [Planctomycetota bacterium]